jgi:hypothetical protein
MNAELKIVARIKELKLSGTPAEKIIKRAANPLWRYVGHDAALAEQLCRNVYWFGRNGNPVWTWGQGSGGNPTGEALARGQVSVTNCGGFNATARWIGIEVLGLTSVQFAGSFTDANDCFVTLAGTQGIDRNWAGSVRTLTQDFAQVSAYFFKGHSFNRFGGNMLDATTNVMNFRGKTDLFWCALALTNGSTAAGDGRAFMVTQRHQPTPIPGNAPYACVSSKALKTFRHHFPIVAVAGGPRLTQSFIQALPATSGSNWETFVLASRDDLSPAFRKAVNLP